MKGHYKRHKIGLSEIERFMLHVEHQPNGCMNWTASTRTGYGQMKFRGVMERAHRISYMLFKGPIPEGMCVLHKCIGNRLCVNPDHLYPGTKKDNCRDRKEQGRDGNHKGEANGRATVTEAIVIEMRKLRPPNYRLWTPSYKEIAAKFGTSVDVAKNIINGYTWKHLLVDNIAPVTDKPNSE